MEPRCTISLLILDTKKGTPVGCSFEFDKATMEVETRALKKKGQSMKLLKLTNQEIVGISKLLNEIFGPNRAIGLAEFLLEAPLFGHELPRRIRAAFYRFKLLEDSIGLCIRGNPVDEALGPTPTNLRSAGKVETISRGTALHVLYASLLGECFAWSTIQDGYIVNDLLPVKEKENTRSGSGSKKDFMLHTEDAHHPHAGDYLGLMCLRNLYRVPTIISGLPDLELDRINVEILFQPRFLASPNVAHSVSANTRTLPVLFGKKESPYMRINANTYRAVNGDSEAQSALDAFIRHLENNTKDLLLLPGDCCYLDNYRVAHGRKRFVPRYDGKDRWLKRLYITGYLRKTRTDRKSPEDRVVIDRL